MRLSEDVEYISLHKPLPFVLQGYVWPFVLLYTALLAVWVGVYGFLEYTEAFLIGFAIIGGLNIVTCLFGVWSVHVRCALTCTKASSVQEASLVKVVPTPNNGFTELVKLVKQKDKLTGEQLIWFMFQKTKYLYDQKEGKFQLLKFHTSEPYSYYRDCRGYTTDMKAEAAKQLYGKNKLDVESPDFWSLFKERATAPFFVFQVFCVGLWCLDEYWYYSLFTLAMLISFEAILVKQQQRNLSEIRKMGTKAFKMQVYRDKKWIRMSSDELLPGDIVSICRSKDDDVVPCDILLLYGHCIVDEALLTGESVPQMKEPLNFSLSKEVLNQERLNLERDARLHMISGGTRIVQHSPPEKTFSDKMDSGISLPKDRGCIGYVLRTSFNTNQGKLLRTILYGVKRVTANNFETFIFIMFLLVFAIMAAAYVWIKGTEDPERNRYKLFLECTLILTSVVPPELPIELSLAVNTSLIALAKLGIYCTEPFRIPFGGKVDVCCFDKTGTLTSDNLVVQGIAGLPKPQDKNSAHHSTPRRSTPSSTHHSTPRSAPSSTPSRSKQPISITVAKECSSETQCVLASCQSLTYLDGDIVGDPLEKVSLKAIDWTLDRNDTLTSPPSLGKNISLKIIRRFHFSSALKRMSAVCSVSTASSSPTYLATVKGAPEVLRDMLTSVPDDYDATYSKLMRQGARVLALGYKNLGNLTHGKIYSMKRHHIEAHLTFAGFLVIICPLKEDSKQNIRCLHDSSHHVIMLTGDNPLTACHVAKELKITQRKLLILSHMMSSDDDNDVKEWEWQSIGGASKASLETDPAQLGKEYDLCVTGDGLTYLLTRGSRAQAFFSQLLPYIKVFARVSPKQKELAVTTFKSLGYNTLMCGDGTNDVGALKHAHVGVALLSTIKSKKKQVEGEDGTPVDASAGDGERGKAKEGKGGGGASSPLVPKTDVLKRKDLHPQLTAQQIREKKLKDLLKQMDETEPQLVRLGDASIASPFTSRKPSISCICHVIKQGRCTLVTTLQMFKILALNALILAYSQSVLYLDGIKFSDLQATIQGFLLAGCFLFISRSKPLTSLSKERPLPNIFNLYTILTVMLQFFVHFFCLIFLVKETKAIVGHSEEDIDLEKEFEQNELNSAVYLISMAMQISNFAVNYKGHPFMETLTENKPLLYSILGSAGAVLILASGIIPELSASLQIETFTEEFRHTLIIVLLADFAMAYVVDRILSYFLGTAKLKLLA